jgi:putative hydrolase of the HAD superfamily
VGVRLSELDTIIFDLGEVIVDLDPQAVVDEFSRLTKADGKQIRDFIVQSNYLYEYETGQLSDNQFVDAVNGLFQTSVSVEDFQKAWNMMIKGISSERLQFLDKLMKTHQVLLLSNTNRMHEVHFDQLVHQMTGKLMKDHSHHAYYSHQIGHRKPDQSIYHYVLDDQQLDPKKSLFLDDREENILAAKAVGLKAAQVHYPDQIFELLAHE